MDAVALASVITSGVIGAADYGVAGVDAGAHAEGRGEREAAVDVGGGGVDLIDAVEGAEQVGV